MGNKRPDHIPVSLIATLGTNTSLPAESRRRPEYDRLAVLSAIEATDADTLTKAMDLEKYFDDMPPISVDVDPSSHSYLVDCYKLEGVAASLPPLPFEDILQ